MDDDEDGKLLTPDDERSSDSGFRDKGSLSESVEDACDEKYNLEDIDAELEEQYGKPQDTISGDDSQDTKTEIKDDSVLSTDSEGLRSCDATYVVNEESESVSNLSVSTIKPSESSSDMEEVSCLPTEPLNKQERLNKLDSALDSNIDLYFDPQPKTGWYLHPPPGSSSLDSQPINSGWLPSAPEEGRDSSYVSFDIDEECVTAIRNELKEKLPCAQNAERMDVEEDISPEEDRTDMIIQYNTFPAPLSPIIEERESLSSNQSSLLLDDGGNSIESSGKISPLLYIGVRREGEEGLCNFEDEIKNALDVCNSESTDSDNVLVIVEDLENAKAGQACKEKIVETAKEEIDDVLIVDTETNKVTLYESPKPQSHLAFVRQVSEQTDYSSSANSESSTFYHSADDNLLSVDRNNVTYTPDSVSPLSTGSSRTGVAVSFSSSETGGNLSGFYLSPSSVRSDLFDNGPPSLPFDLGTYDIVEEIRPNNEAEEIMQELVEAGIMKEDDLTNERHFTNETLNCGIVDSKDASEVSSETVESQTTEDEKLECEYSVETSTVLSNNCESLDATEQQTINKDNFNSNNLNKCSISPKKNNILSCDKIDELLVSENKILQPFEESHSENKISDSKDWLKSLLLSSASDKSNFCESDKSASDCLKQSGWPSAEELIAEPLPATRCESQVVVTTPESPNMDLLEVAAKFNDVNSTLAISTPNNMSFDESKDNSQLSSFTSTPTLETVKFITGSAKCSEKLVTADQNNSLKELGSRMKSIPTLSNLASEIVLHLPVSEEKSGSLSQDSSPDDSERAKRLQGMTLALEPSVLSKAPMPSPEDADKGAWRPTMGQLMELTSQPEQDDMMTTSFIDADNNDYAPDWESDTSDDSEEHSSSSGEFVWRVSLFRF